jgi:hypothetical protein
VLDPSSHPLLSCLKPPIACPLAVSPISSSPQACEEQEEEGLDADSLFVSKTWLNGFKKRTTLGANPTVPTAAITCCHGCLMPDQGQGSKRTALPPHVFDMLVGYWARDQAAAQLAPPPARKGRGAAAAAAAAEEEHAGSGE